MEACFRLARQGGHGRVSSEVTILMNVWYIRTGRGSVEAGSIPRYPICMDDGVDVK